MKVDNRVRRVVQLVHFPLLSLQWQVESHSSMQWGVKNDTNMGPQYRKLGSVMSYT